MLRIGERNLALVRLYSARTGRGRDDDRLPPRFHEPLPRGASAGRPLGREEFRAEAEACYRRRGWTKSGLSKAKLRSLGLEDLAGT
jgi:aldehyde:ferredoxin oxidoreductase